jgi:BirA family transcriptional regulator, biotin operon repressor / biotin---[acetyl-CoA-carboxylase] ligase
MTIENLLTILSDGEFHSGEELSQCLDVSRTAVWKQVARLEGLGIEINAVKGRGYRLTEDLDLLSLALIYEQLNESTYETFNRIDLHLSTSSTNRLAADVKVAPFACLAESQTAGRGRRGREWVSPFAKNIYLSVAWNFSEQGAALDSLSLCVAVAIAKALRELGCEAVGLKWPNDLLYQNRKLAGILLEASGELGGAIRVVIGIGLNVSMSVEQGRAIGQQWISLAELVPGNISRNKVAAALLNSLAAALPAFEQHGFAAFEEDWHSFDCLINRPVDLHIGAQIIPGVARGVDPTGALLIEQDGLIKAYRGGEVSVRAKS